MHPWYNTWDHARRLRAENAEAERREAQAEAERLAEVQSDIDHAMDSLYGNPLALTIPVRHHDRQVGTISYLKEG